MITEEFAPLWLTTINEMADNPVHMLFNQWWSRSPQAVRDAYVAQITDDPQFRSFIDDGYYAEPVDLERLGAMEQGTFGRTYHDWIVDNGLTAQIAMNYRDFHKMLVDAGQLDGMPTDMQYMILRGFQMHDFLHVLTGYDSSGLGEIALQAFCLAQVQFPYFGMWIATVTNQMTYLNPTSIVPLMDAVTDGWQFGRSCPNIQTHRWEDELERSLEEVRDEWGIEPSPLVKRMQAA